MTPDPYVSGGRLKDAPKGPTCPWCGGSGGRAGLGGFRLLCAICLGKGYIPAGDPRGKDLTQEEEKMADYRAFLDRTEIREALPSQILPDPRGKEVKS